MKLSTRILFENESFAKEVARLEEAIATALVNTHPVYTKDSLQHAITTLKNALDESGHAS